MTDYTEPTEPTDAQIRAFKAEWHRADAEGASGDRVRRALRAALNPTPVLDGLEPGYYVTSNNVNEDGAAMPGAAVLYKCYDGEWVQLVTGTVDVRSVAERYARDLGLTRVTLTATPQLKKLVAVIDSDGDRWEPVDPNKPEGGWSMLPTLDHRSLEDIRIQFGIREEVYE